MKTCAGAFSRNSGSRCLQRIPRACIVRPTGPVQVTESWKESRSWKKLLQQVIEPWQMEWSAPIVWPSTKDGLLGFFFDYRMMKAVTKPESYLILRLHECIESLGDAAVFFTLNTNDFYRQVTVKETDRDTTVLKFHHVIYRIVCMLFGLRNATGAFQLTIDTIMSPVTWRHEIVYRNDTLVFSRSQVRTSCSCFRRWFRYGTQE